MKTLDDIRRQLGAGEFELSRHALQRAVERDVGMKEIQEAGCIADLIEDYPKDKYAQVRYSSVSRRMDGTPFARILCRER